MTTMMGVPATYLFLSQAPRFATADLSSLRLAVVGGAPMPEALLETWQRARRRDRPGLRPDRGGAERALPAARGRACASSATRASRTRTSRSRSRLGRAMLEARRRAARARARTSSPATGGTPRRPRRRSCDGWLRTGDVAERDDEGYYRIRGRLKEHVHLGRRERLPGRGRGACCTSIRPSPRRPSSACPTSAGARSASRSSSSRAERGDRRRVHRATAASGSRASRCRSAVRFVEALPRSAMNKVLKDELRRGAARRADDRATDGRRRPTLCEARRAHAPAPARGGRARLRRARLPRRLDRQDHRGRRRRRRAPSTSTSRASRRSSTSSSST